MLNQQSCNICLGIANGAKTRMIDKVTLNAIAAYTVATEDPEEKVRDGNVRSGGWISFSVDSKLHSYDSEMRMNNDKDDGRE